WPDGQFVTWHGGDGGNQDGIAHDPELSLIAAAALPAGGFTRAVKRVAAQRLGERRHTSSWSFLRSRVRGQCAAHLVWNRPRLISLRAKRSSGTFPADDSYIWQEALPRCWWRRASRRRPIRRGRCV